MTCPVCAYRDLPYPPSDYNICPCCGTEFGNDDAFATHEELQQRWINAGLPWFFGAPPEHWNGFAQLLEGYRIENLPRYAIQPVANGYVTFEEAQTRPEVITDATSNVVYA